MLKGGGDSWQSRKKCLNLWPKVTLNPKTRKGTEKMTKEKRNTEGQPAEVLSFRKGDNLATVATNGQRTVSQEFELVKEHRSLTAAISYLEAKGYEIIQGGFESI